ncbi:hypothetical protein BaRGS_00000706 [Batillaria attramentaria]|uniref:Mitochondrial cardiolipin hydrolase n=1 Tax=Batillaria attramentaria TaxID=370345 RepID=A0ABD0M8L9_9CAEN
MNSFLKGSIGTLALFVLSEIGYRMYLRWKNRSLKSTDKSESRKDGDVMEVFFFPDKEIPCKVHFLSETRCFKDSCKYSHRKTSLSELYRYLGSCRRSMDVCVFVMTCVDLADIVVSMRQRGVAVRVITDDEQEKITGSQIWRLRKEGICVRTDHSSNFMHHKFVVVDDQLLINGSFNWTRNAITGNQENVIVTNHTRVVGAFKAEFEKLWEQFDPKNHFESKLNA